MDQVFMAEYSAVFNALQGDDNGQRFVHDLVSACSQHSLQVIAKRSQVFDRVAVRESRSCSAVCCQVGGAQIRGAGYQR